MAEGFSVDPGALADALDEMDDFQRTAASLLDEIESTVQALHVTWSGEAAAGHAEAHRLWTHGAAQMQEALGKLHTAGGHAHGNYTGVMDANRSNWS
jgi:WXG100 family type VII secretion target